jgi:glutathione synthase/RimK-type ligase-like ATP-grasp enzyme
MSALTPVTIVPRETLKKNDYLIQLSPQLFHHLNIEKGQVVTISLGKKTINLKIRTVEMNDNEILIPEHLYSQFCLPINKYKFYARFKPELNTLYLGPIIGLLTDFNINGTEEPYFRSIHTFCEELHHGVKENGGFFYVFSYQQFSIQGYYFEDGKWHTGELPLPDVIYNRIHSRRLEQSHEFKTFRNKLSALNIPYFNDRFLSKWEVHEQIMNENLLHSYIPETKIFSLDNFMEFAKEYETVFIKPIHGSQGRNILKLVKEDTLYTLHTSIKAKSEISANKCTLNEIYHQIKNTMNNRIYILQQGIPLITYNSRGMDFRVLCHKNHHNLWEVTSVVARISGEDEFVSNISRGGEVMPPLTALGAVMNKMEAKEIFSQMKELSIETASVISCHAAGIIGELGIDIGIDQNGRPWLIEVNSKPSKNFEDGHMKIRPSAKAIIKFCTTLAFDLTIDKEES